MWSPKPARVLFKCLLGRNEGIFDQYYQPECEILFDKSANQGLANNNNNIIVSPSLLNNMNDCFLNKLHSFHRLLPCLQSSVCGTRAPALFDSDLFKKKTKKKHSCVKWLWFLFIGRLQLIRDITCIGTTLERVFKTCTCSR